MPTKDELTAENAELKAKIAELEEVAESGGETVSVDDTLQAVIESVTAMVGLERWNEAVEIAAEEAGEDVEADYMEMGEDDETYEVGFLSGLDGHEEIDAIMHVLLRQDTLVRIRAEDGTFAEPEEGAMYRYDGSGDLVKTDDSGEGDAVAMLRADLQRVTIERDDARNQLGSANKRLSDAIALHGKIDNLPPVT